MRNLEEIQTLLDKYWSGETTLEEERSLKAYFAGPLVHERYHPFLPLFQTLQQEQSVLLEQVRVVPMRARTSNPIRWAIAASVVTLLGIGAWWMSRPVTTLEVVAETPAVKPAPVPAPEPPAVAPLPQPNLVAITQTAPVRKHAVKTKKINAAPPIDAETEQAMEEIKAALSLVSAKLNKGKKAALKDLNQLETMDKFLKPKIDS